MKNSGATIKFSKDSLSVMSGKFGKRMAQYDKMLEQRMRSATQAVWAIAHAKRPLITKTEMKASGRTYRVSNPNERYGVPVRTGALQSSIQQEVTRTKNSTFQGRVWTQGIPYAGAMEFGSGKIAARPFMRPAVNLSGGTVKKIFSAKVSETP